METPSEAIDFTAVVDRSEISSQASAVGTLPVRTCVGCRVTSPKVELVRFVADQGGPDLVSRLHRDDEQLAPGRGAYLHPDRACWGLAQRRRAFQRALRLTAGLESAEWEAYFAPQPPN